LVEGALAERLGRDSCERDLVCAPTELAVDPGATPRTCHAAGELEGRCLPSCLPDVAAQAEQLTRAECSARELCLPCFDPLSGEDTGACHVGGDPGPREPPRVFASCCQGLGRCVPSAGIDSADRERVAVDVCSTADDALCVPSAWLSEPQAAPQSCRTSIEGEGRCLPSCLPDVARQSAQLDRGACEQGALCVPCFDPRDGADTGACRTGDDEPRDEPARLPSCCEGLGRCIAQDQLASSERARLSSDSCERAELCAPSAWLADEPAEAESCRAAGDREGRCLPACLPDVSAQADRLQRSSCDAGHACVPCFDPITGKTTGACALPGDDGPREPSEPAAACCDGLGLCLPQALIDDEQSEKLPTDGCAASADEVCVPIAWLDGGPPASCRAPGQLEGRCFPSCLPEVAEQRERLTQSNCGEHELCLPCFDPLTGEDTEACRTANDPGPQEGPEPFAMCCGEVGRCLPRSLVPDEARASLERETCAASYDALCTPSAWIEASAPPSCRAPGELEGRCLPRCLPQVAQLGARAVQADCATEHACVPCFDPLTGAESGACRTPGDQGPREPAVAFDRCCSDGERTLGTCLPASLLPDAQVAAVPAELCADGFACAPDALVRTPEVGLPACVSRLLGVGPAEPGACVPQCLLGDSAALLSRASCAAAERCVPCASLPLETAACD